MFPLRSSFEYSRMHVHRSYSAFSEHLTSSFSKGLTNASLRLRLQAKAGNIWEKHTHTHAHFMLLYSVCGSTFRCEYITASVSATVTLRLLSQSVV